MPLWGKTLQCITEVHNGTIAAMLIEIMLMGLTPYNLCFIKQNNACKVMMMLCLPWETSGIMPLRLGSTLKKQNQRLIRESLETAIEIIREVK